MTLDEYLESVKNKPYRANKHNCIKFTNECWKITYGKYWAEDFLKVKTFKEISAEYESAVAAVDSKLDRQTLVTAHSLVAIKVPTDTLAEGLVFGYCLGAESVFVGKKGLEYRPTKLIRYCWR